MEVLLKIISIFRILQARWIINRNETFNIAFRKDVITSKEFYILGCGSSINDLNDNQIKIINNSDSVGINLLIMHNELKPTYYSVEVTSNSINKSKDNNSNIYSNFVKKKVLETSKLKFIINIDNWMSVKKLMPDFNTYGEINLIQQLAIPTIKNRYFKEINKFLLSKNITRFLSPEIIYGKNASVISLVYLAILRGYKDIILCGVDLSSEYFWEVDRGFEKYPDAKNIINMHKNSRHNTDTSSFPVSEVLNHINNSELGIKIWISSASSNLCNLLPVYPFNE